MTTTVVRRFDRAEMRIDEKRTPQGFLKADARIARTGVQTYRLADGSQRREYRPPDEVFHPDAIASFHLAPLTLGHPSEPVTHKNADKYTKGVVLEPGKHEDARHVKASVLVMHADAIDAALSGTASQISAGYKCNLEDCAGTTADGEAYDAIQHDIRANHVALVQAGRAGSAQLVLDGLDA